MAAKTVPDYPRGVTFEQVWMALMETDRIVKENANEVKEFQKETDRRIRKFQKETARQIQETDKQMKETDKRLDKQLGNRFGEMVEYMVVPNLITKFGDLGFAFEKAYQHATIEDRKNNIFTEIDITLENGDKVMIVEVKSKPTTEDITDHIERMAKVKAHAQAHGDRRKFMGAVAGMVFNNNEKIFAMKNGFFVIEPSGETFNITPPDQPKEW
jgi:hypothetical protein